MNIKLLTDPALKALFTFLIQGSFNAIKRKVNSHSEETVLFTNEQEIKSNVIDEVKKGFKWAESDLFSNHKNNFNIYKRYVHLDLLLEPRRLHVNKKQLKSKKPLDEILKENNNNIVILGQPGSGKTTSTRYIINSILVDPYFLNGIYSIPIVIRLRELNKENLSRPNELKFGIYAKLSEILGIKIKINNEKLDPQILQESKDKLIGKIIPSVLENLKVLLILDGFDEITDFASRSLIIEELKDLSKSLDNVNFLITSRGADFKYRIENTEIYEISELSNDQITEFSEKWFEDDKLSKTFLKELYEKTPYRDFYRRPLLLTHLAGIYSKSREIPDKPKLIYQTIIDLVLKEWNEIQGVKRTSKYASFTVNRKREFLSALAFYLTIKYERSVFTNNILRETYELINNKFQELNLSEIDEVIEEIESHNGIIIKSGVDSFEFSHLTIQEYLVADYIVRGGSIRLSEKELVKIPYELAVAISLSSEPSILLYDLIVEKIFRNNIHMNFLNRFCERLEIEKPDFEIGPVLIISLLTIYTKLANKEQETITSQRKKKELEDYIVDRIRFEDYIEKSLPNSFINDISEYYEIDNTKFKTKSNFEYIGLRKKKEIVNEILKFKFPKYLLWNKKKYYMQNDIKHI